MDQSDLGLILFGHFLRIKLRVSSLRFTLNQFDYLAQEADFGLNLCGQFFRIKLSVNSLPFTLCDAG